MKITIFYSWQSQTSEKANKNFIKKAIEKAIKKAKRKPDFKSIEYDLLEGMSGEPGQKPLADTIIDERIPKSDIFIADLTIVNSHFGLHELIRKLFRFKSRPEHNNNVMYESGVARSNIGNERIIHIQNTYWHTREVCGSSGLM
jgi:uncharacterized membrane-anchored protein YjiN (DUF445 family)